jgi:hypothetical protein
VSEAHNYSILQKSKTEKVGIIEKLIEKVKHNKESAGANKAAYYEGVASPTFVDHR